MNDSFVELVAATNYSFLRGASHPSDMVARAMELGLAGIGIADRNSVAGVVRAHVARQRAGPERAGFRLVVGTRLIFSDGSPDIVLYPINRRGWGRLTGLLTRGNLRAIKGGCILTIDDLLCDLDDLLLIVLPVSTSEEKEEEVTHRKPVDFDFGDNANKPGLSVVRAHDLDAILRCLVHKASGRVWLGVGMDYLGSDARRLTRLARQAVAAEVPLLATNDALYAAPACRPLHDVLSCIRTGSTIAEAGRGLLTNGERHIKSPTEMARLFRAYPDAVAETSRFLANINFSLEQLGYEYPHEPVPEGWEPSDWLEHLVIQEIPKRYSPDRLPVVRKLLSEEMELIRSRNYAYYFLTVHDLVKFAQSCNPPILCQGRGSAANSVICFLLGVTSIDPLIHNLLFSRFVSDNRDEPPDVDIDFEHERREEVMQYVYRRYGRHRAGIAATVIHYRSRSALREVAKVLGLSGDIAIRLSDTVWGSYASDVDDRKFLEAGLDITNPEIVRLRFIMNKLLEAPFPRHLSQHVGGFVLTQDRLDTTVPVLNATMTDRTFIEWDKDDIEALGLMKVDVLSLGMLTCIRKAYDLMRENGLGDHSLTIDLKADDEDVYKMLQKGDSIGVFQVESRAQINMLPRLKPKCLYDLTVQIAIVRPGPIEGDMVHPYLRRRNGEEKVEYPAPRPPNDPDELRGVLGKTFGVPLFQEQVMRLAMTAAGFTPGEADQLRRAMATFRNAGTMHTLKSKLIEGMVDRGYERDFAMRCYKQIEGFGSYGFPESHALSFARLVYVSAWIKYHQPAVFACALLNSQPMGFYAPAQLIIDARRHNVEVRPIDINASNWDNSLERREDGTLALRLGLRQLTHFRQDWARSLVEARKNGPFDGIEALARRATLPQRALRLLADGDAFGSLALPRRQALWDVRRTPNNELPLFAAARARELGEEPDAMLPRMEPAEEVATDYQLTRLSLKGHPMQFLRPLLAEEGALSCAEINDNAKAGARVKGAGIVLVRQRPGKGNAIFITLEDDTGVINIMMWARVFETMRRAVMTSRLMLVEGEIQRSREGVVHLKASRVHDRSHLLNRLTDSGGVHTTLSRADIVANPQTRDADRRYSTSDPSTPRHPRNVRILPRSRDFH